MRLKFPDAVFDYDLNLFEEIAELLDRRIHQLLSVDGETADMLDYGIAAEHVIGLGLASAQVYLVGAIATHRAERQAALALGPRHPSGRTIAQLINHGANFWKHADEWNYDQPDNRRQAILDAFSDLRIPDEAYPLFELACQLVDLDKPSLCGLLPLLQAWRDAVEDEFPESARTNVRKE